MSPSAVPSFYALRALLIASAASFLLGCGGTESGGTGGGGTPMEPEVPRATKVVFTAQPSDAELGSTIGSAIRVAIQDSAGKTVTSAHDPVTLEVGSNPGNGSLVGSATVDAVDGVATFADLGIDEPGSGYTLVARSGQLTAATSEPFDIYFLFSSISAGGAHTCAVGSGDRAYCWGANGAGQLGDGNSAGSDLPSRVVGGLMIASISAGHDHTCAITISGTAYCWGDNDRGQLGDGSTNGSITPVVVAGGLSFAWISAGYDHTCGIAVDGTGYCWGANTRGQIGDGTRNDRTTPTAISSDSALAAISAGGGVLVAHTLGVTTGDAGLSWGGNNVGQLGRSASGDCGGVPCDPGPGFIGGTEDFRQVSAGQGHSCGVTPGGDGYCWGANGSGQVGDGSTAGERQQPTAVSGGHGFSVIRAGRNHTCGLTTTGQAWCWGVNIFGQLGDGTGSGSSRIPVAVAGGLQFVQLSVGDNHSCGVTADGAVYCWGANGEGQIGDGTQDDRWDPTPVVSPG